MIPVGSGLPWWLPTELFLSSDEVRRLEEDRLGNGGTCLLCGNPPCSPAFRLEGAHIWRGGMSGRKNGGPKIELCRECHQGREGIDNVGDKTLAVARADYQIHYLEAHDGVVVYDKPLGVYARRSA